MFYSTEVFEFNDNENTSHALPSEMSNIFKSLKQRKRYSVNLLMFSLGLSLVCPVGSPGS